MPKWACRLCRLWRPYPPNFLGIFFGTPIATKMVPKHAHERRSVDPAARSKTAAMPRSRGPKRPNFKVLLLGAVWPSERPTVRYIYDQCQPYWSCRPLMHPSTTGAFIRVLAHPPAHLLTSVHPTRATLRRRTPVRRPRRPSSAPIPTTFESQNPAMHENPLSRAIRPHT